MTSQIGYEGEIVLISPEGEVEKFNVPGRHKTHSGKIRINEGFCERKNHRRQDKRFRQRLSVGWHIATPQELELLAGEEWKKGTSLVIGTTLTGDQSHGGNHNSGEVDHQAKRPRGNRGSRSRRRRRDWQQKSRLFKKVSHSGGFRNPLQSNPGLMKSAEETGRMLEKIAGKSYLKVQRGVTINIEKLLIALEIGTDPLPSLEYPDEKPRLKVLVSPDCSGSTHDWSGLGRAWALHLSQMPDSDVFYIENNNGVFDSEDDQTVVDLKKFDLVVYLGDGDGDLMCHRYASQGAIVIALDSYCSTDKDPRLQVSEPVGSGYLFWVTGVGARAPETWTKGVQLCLERGGF